MKTHLWLIIAVLMTLIALAMSVTIYKQSRTNEQLAGSVVNLRTNGEATRQYAEERHDRSPPAFERVNQGDTALAAFEFLVGTWRGEMDGGLVEEIWSKPEGNAMMGMFRWLNTDGLSRVYELLTISRDGDETILRLRHFTPAMIAWEEKDAPVVLKLTESSDRRAVFVNTNEEDRLERIVFHQPETEKLRIDVEFREGSGRGPLNFRFDAAR